MAIDDAATRPASDELTAELDGATHSGGSGGFGPGATFGRYQIQRVIGAGGSGLVLAAHDAELGRGVAIKLLAYESAETRTRLLREAKAMAQLSHRNVVTVYEVVRLDDRTGIVMELVDGDDLAKWRAAAPRTWREVVAAYVQAAHGLGAAHRLGLVHRDFKPANALIDRDGVVRVTDFGLVRAASAADPLTPSSPSATALDGDLTRTGARLGTPAYMAPEQHAGEAVDARTDQWALACALYGALYDQRPFAGDTMDALADSVQRGQLRDEPRTIAVPRRVRAAIRRALAVDPTQRFPSMTELIAALAPPRRGWLVAAGVSAAAITGALVANAARPTASGPSCAGLDAPMVATWNPTRADAVRDRLRAVTPATAERTATRVRGALDAYRDAWSAARVTACTQARQGAASGALLDRRDRCLAGLRVAADTIIGELLVAPADEVDRVVGAVERLRPIADCDDPRETMPRPTDAATRAELERGEALFARAYALGDIGYFDRAKPLCEEVLAIGERTGWLPLTARAHLQLGRSLSHEHDGVAAIAAFDRAASAGARAADDEVVADALVARMFDVADTLGRPAEALAARPYVEVALERAGSPPRLMANWFHHVAIILYHLQRFDEALAAEERSAALLDGSVGPDNIARFDSLDTIAYIQLERGHPELAEQAWQRVLVNDLRLHGAESLAAAQSYANLGRVAQRRGNVTVALDRWRESEDALRASGVQDWPLSQGLGQIRWQVGRWRAALPSLTAAMAAAAAGAPGDTQPVVETTTALARALIARGDLDAAAPLVAQAVRAAKGCESPMLPETLAMSASLAFARGDLAEAERVLIAARAAAGAESVELPLVAGALAHRRGDCARAVDEFTIAQTRASAAGDLLDVARALAGALGCRPDAARADALAQQVAQLEALGADPEALAGARAALARARRAR